MIAGLHHRLATIGELQIDRDAQAFTHGSDIYFNEGNYDTGSQDGQKLIAHELTHVVQQTGSRPIQAKIQRSTEHKIGNWAHFKIQKLLST